MSSHIKFNIKPTKKQTNRWLLFFSIKIFPDDSGQRRLDKHPNYKTSHHPVFYSAFTLFYAGRQLLADGSSLAMDCFP